MKSQLSPCCVLLQYTTCLHGRIRKVLCRLNSIAAMCHFSLHDQEQCSNPLQAIIPPLRAWLNDAVQCSLS